MSIKIENYTKIIKNNTVLDNINCHFEDNKIYGIRGKNGSGKTMLLRAIAGLIYPTKWHIFIDNEELGKTISFPRSIGILIENPCFINNYSAFQNLNLLAGLQKITNIEEVIRLIRAIGLDPESKKTYKKFSLGMKQRLGIAAALLGNPKIILLDEPTNALDDMGTQLVRDILIEFKNMGSTIIIASHDMEELQYLSDEILIMSEGKLQPT